MTAEIMEKVKQRVEAFGLTLTDADSYILELTAEKVEFRIMHACNISTVPDCMTVELIDAVCGEFLAGKKAAGQLSDIELDEVVKAITDGDTKTEFATGNRGASEIFDAYVKKLTEIDMNAIVAHRKLKW